MSKGVVRLPVAATIVLMMLQFISSERAEAGDGEYFDRAWSRTDHPVANGRIMRTWMWGPQPATTVVPERYADSPGGERQVQYFDKSRMEITDPDAASDALWYVTNGLLVVELVTGQMQVGDHAFEQNAPARVNIAGDPGSGPTYAALGKLLNEPPLSEGAVITQRLNADGSVHAVPDPSHPGVHAAYHVPETRHTIAGPFWDFMNSTDLVYQDGAYVNAPLFVNPFYATGFPITEAYWTQVTVGGAPKDVLVQCFERRCLTYTPDNPADWRVEAGNVGQHYYQWRYGSAPDTVSASGPAVLVGAGDIADCRGDGDEETAALLDHISGTVFTTGDTVYESGTPEEFANCYEPSWGRHKYRTRPAVGDHEYGTTNASGYFDYFGSAAGEPDKGYYSYDLGAWRIVVLNTQCSRIGGCDAGSRQERWLRADLAAHPAACTLAYMHHPRFSSGSHGSNPSVGAFWEALYDYGVDVVLAGHDHSYERFAPQNPYGHADQHGIRQFVVGTGGKSTYDFGTIQPNSEVRNGDTNGVLKLTLHPDRYDWQFVPVSGQTFTDSGSTGCH